MLPRPASRIFMRLSRRDHPAQLGPRWNLAVIHALDAVAERSLDGANVPHQPHEPLWLYRCGMITAPHRAIEREMPLDDAGAQDDGGERGGEADFVSRVADRDAVAVSEPADDLQIQFLDSGRIRARTVKQDEIVLAEHAHSVVDLLG